MISKQRRFYYQVVWLIFLSTLTGCIGHLPPLEAKIISLTPCTGWDSQGRPVGITTTFKSDTERIYVCGRLESNQKDITIRAIWDYEGKIIFRDDLFDVEEYFHSYLPSEDGHYKVGKYRVEILLVKSRVISTEFYVED